MQLKSRADEFNRMKNELLRSRRAVSVLTGADAEAIRTDAAFRELVTPLQLRRQQYIKRKKEHGDREEETLKKLQSFTNFVKKTKSFGANDEDRTKLETDGII